jgi:integrase
MARPLMATIKLKYVHSYADRHGKQRHYFKRGKAKAVALKGEPGSAEFMDAYAAALAEQAPPTARKSDAQPGTFAALAAAYYGSPNYAGLGLASRRNYRRVIDHFIVAHGHRLVRQFKREHVVKIIGEMGDRPGAGIILLKRIRTLTRFALDLGWIAVDPTHKVRSYRSREIHTWSEEEIAQFEKRWKIGTKERLAFALHLYTGQRGSDVHRMGWPDIAGDTIKVVQQKTGEKLTIALHPALMEVLRHAPKKHVAIITTEYGEPFSVKGFGQYVSAAIQKAGLPDRCKAHGLRKAAARRLAEAGCTAKQIAAITGHKTLSEVERYTRAADQEQLGRQAIEKQAANNSVANRLANLKEKAAK